MTVYSLLLARPPIPSFSLDLLVVVRGEGAIGVPAVVLGRDRTVGSVQAGRGNHRACARTVAVAVGPCSEWVFAARGCGHSNRKHFWSLNQSESSGVMRLLPQPVGPGESPKGINSWLMAKEATAVSRAATHHTSFGPGSPDSISVLWYVSFSFRPRHHLW